MKIKFRKLLLVCFVFGSLMHSNIKVFCTKNKPTNFNINNKKLEENNEELNKELNEEIRELTQEYVNIVNNLNNIQQNIVYGMRKHKEFFKTVEDAYTPSEKLLSAHQKIFKEFLPQENLRRPETILETKNAFLKKIIFDYSKLIKEQNNIDKLLNESNYGNVENYNDLDLAKKLQEINVEFTSLYNKKPNVEPIVFKFNVFLRNLINFLEKAPEKFGLEHSKIIELLYNKINKIANTNLNSNVSIDGLIKTLKNRVLACKEFFNEKKENLGISEYSKIIHQNDSLMGLVAQKYVNNSFKVDLNAFRFFEKYYNKFLDLLKEYDILRKEKHSQKIVEIQELIDEIAQIPENPTFEDVNIKSIKNNIKKLKKFMLDLYDLDKKMTNKAEEIKKELFEEMEVFNPYQKDLKDKYPNIKIPPIHDINSLIFLFLREMAIDTCHFFLFDRGEPLFSYNEQNKKLQEKICKSFKNFATNPNKKIFSIQSAISFSKRKLKTLESDYKKLRPTIDNTLLNYMNKLKNFKK